MLKRSVSLLTAAAAYLAAAAGPAAAEFFPGEPIDGPDAGLGAVSSLDVARDGSGAVAYTKRDGEAVHAFVSRLVNGVFQPAERIDVGMTGAASQPVVAASDGGRLLAAFVNGGSLFTATRGKGAPAFSAPQPLSANAINPSVDMSINGAAYVSFTVPGASAADVRVAGFGRDAVNGTLLGAPLDIDPARDAGEGSKRSQVVVSADGTAVVTWGEAGGDGRTHVFARRVFGTNLSQAPQDLTLDALEGRRGLSADLPDIDIEDDSSYAWVVFRQGFDDGGTARAKVIARRLVGSQFEPPAVVDGLGFGGDSASAPAIDLNGRGLGLIGSVAAGSNTIFGSFLQDDAPAPASGVGMGGSGIAPEPQPAIGETGDAVLAWRQATPTGAIVRARRYNPRPGAPAPGPGPEVTLTKPELGPVDPEGGFKAASNRAGDVAVVFVQGTGGERRLVSAVFDRPPGTFRGNTSQRYRNATRPLLSWSPAFDLWGPVTYRVEIDGQPVGETTDTKLTTAIDVPDGDHRWRAVATDRRGQTSATASRLLRIDAAPPDLSFFIRGTRKAGAQVRIQARAADVLNPTGSGVKLVRIDFGDRSPAVAARTAVHRFRRGTFTVRVSATDRAGNATVLTRRVRIAK
jgi:hypothetical protein